MQFRDVRYEKFLVSVQENFTGFLALLMVLQTHKNISKCGNAFPRVIYKSIQNSQTSHDCIFHILLYFTTKLHNFTKFMMLFPAVLTNFPNSKVCLIGEWFIEYLPLN